MTIVRSKAEEAEALTELGKALAKSIEEDLTLMFTLGFSCVASVTSEGQFDIEWIPIPEKKGE